MTRLIVLVAMLLLWLGAMVYFGLQSVPFERGVHGKAIEHNKAQRA